MPIFVKASRRAKAYIRTGMEHRVLKKLRTKGNANVRRRKNIARLEKAIDKSKHLAANSARRASLWKRFDVVTRY